MTLSPKRARLCGLTIALALLCFCSEVFAQPYDDASGPSWRRRSENRVESPQDYALEIRFGPYKPKIDDEFGGTGPYEQVFGNGRRYYIGVELDYQLLRIPHFGTLGPGVSLGYTRSKAKALRQDNGEESAEETLLWIMPMYAVGVLRLDVLARDLGVPLVPYAKLGLGYALWSTSDGSGTSSYSVGNGETEQGKGSSYGWHIGAGLMLQLDPFDAHAARQLDNSVGVNHSYAYLEWIRSDLNGFGADDQLQVGTSTWIAGLAFEF